ncbi:unnamed protein product [Didymodactylos carnosus]|uniref:IGFBP N-terminal domain-containing protein n=1 Tax=Didymodactylos carnosus TaxID=1234261 RepID=A0A8S2L851_9BILA|nr:unnamed protein product [Didymodactylos carnosus]CAF3887706.1 unnamed protein product [Didymodactylos carnosus]
MLNSLLLMVFIILSRLVVNDIKLIASGVNINNNNNNEQQSLFNTENKIDKKPTTTTKTRQNEELILTTTSTITSTTTQKELNDTTTILTSLLLTIMPPSTFSYNIHNNDQHQELIESILTEQTIMTNNEEKLAHSQSELFVIPIISDENANDCTECDLDYCLENIHYNKNCTKLIRDQCNCCTVCLRYIDETCGGKLNVRGICDNGLNCENINVNNNKRSTEQIGKCVKSMYSIIL